MVACTFPSSIPNVAILLTSVVCATQLLIKTYRARRNKQRRLLRMKLSAAKRLDTMKTNEVWKVERNLLYTDSHWYKSYVFNPVESAAHHAEGTSAGKLFRTRFRLPFSLYLQLLQQIQDAEKQPESILYRSCAGPKTMINYPVELLLLGALRYVMEPDVVN